MDGEYNKHRIIAFSADAELTDAVHEKYFDWFLHTIVWNAVYKSSLAKQVLFPENVVHEDNYASGMYYALAKKVVVLKSAYYNYSVNNNGISKGGVKRPLDKCIAVSKLIHDFLPLKINLKRYKWKLSCEIYHFIRGWNHDYKVHSVRDDLYKVLMENLDLRRKLSVLWYIKTKHIIINEKGDILDE